MSLHDSRFLTEPTRRALTKRIKSAAEANHLAPHLIAILKQVCLRLLPRIEDTGNPAVDVDQRLALGESDGWRYDSMPPDSEAYARGLEGFDQTAQAMYQEAFVSLTVEQQDAVLQRVQVGDAPGLVWQTLSCKLFFEELLCEVTEYFYSHPAALDQIGYIGSADARGWKNIGLNESRNVPDVEVIDSVVNGKHPEIVDPVEAEYPRWSAMRKYRHDEVIDAVVIGTGAGGAPLIARLAQAGLRIVALEAGQHFDPARDFATDEREQNKLFWRDERLSAGGDPVVFGKNNSGTGVGGSTLHYTAYVPRPQPDDFQLRTHFGVGADWVIDHAELVPYFEEIETFLGVSGISPYPWDQNRKPYPLPPLPVNGAAQLMQRGCETLGIRVAPAPNAALSGRYYQPGIGWRHACTNRGYCQAGCSVGAKGSMDVTYLPLAVQHGAEIRHECFVTGFERDSQGRITSVIYTHDSTEYRQKCGAVFLCAGAVETPRLLLINGLANSSGAVGRNFMAHTGIQVWGRFDEDVYPHKGIPGGLISEDTHRPRDVDFVGGYLLQSIGVMPVTYGTQYVRGTGTWGEPLHAHMEQYNHVAGINILGECLPYEGNFLELSDEKDARGLPKPRTHFTFGENENRLTRHAEALMRQIWTNAGAQDVWTFPRSAHTIGTCRMGTDADSAVVNPNGRTFDVPNLYISDNSTFASALSVNPSLTIMALSLRTADRFLESQR